MSVARALADMALRRCLRGEALEREALLELLAVPPASDEALYLRHAAHKAALALDGGRAYLWGALGLDYTPCPMNCAFCSLGEAWKLIDAPRSYTETEIIAHARAYVAAGARFVVLRTTQFYDLDALCGMLAAIRKAVPGGYEIILNTGEFDADAALAVRRAGGSGVYHTIRVREGRDTAFDPDVREATMLAAVRAGLRLVALVEPVGPEHADQELADCFLRIMATGASISGVMARAGHAPGRPAAPEPGASGSAGRDFPPGRGRASGRSLRASGRSGKYDRRSQYRGGGKRSHSARQRAVRAGLAGLFRRRGRAAAAACRICGP